MRQIAIRFSRLMPAFALLAIPTFVQAQGQPDFSKVEIKTNKITNNFYTLDGQGGTIGVLTGPDGVFQVDGQFAPLSEKIAAAIKQVSGGNTAKLLVNTHVHGDHTGGNENFAKMGATIMSRTELRDRLALTPNTSAVALPKITYDNQVVLHMDGETIELIPIRRAHTDGDTLVHFVNNDILMTGDYYRSVGYPNIDRMNGGTFDGMARGLAITASLAGPNTKIIPGHGATVDRNAVMAQRDIMLAVRDRVAKLMQQGKSQDEVVAAKVTSDFDPKVPGGAGMTADRFVGQVYAELKAAK
jgi:glyoxylase-like metal-dependent hydrolase (beta-lactamase superfamily II)